MATLLSEFMVIAQPGRKAAVLAYSFALMKSGPAKFVKEDKVLEEIDNFRKGGLASPAIAEDIQTKP